MSWLKYLPALAQTGAGVALMATGNVPMGAALAASGVAQGGATYAGGKAAEKEAQHWAGVQAADEARKKEVERWNYARTPGQAQSVNVRYARQTPDAANFQGGLAAGQMVQGAAQPLYAMMASNQAAGAAKQNRLEDRQLMREIYGVGQRQPYDYNLMASNQRLS